MSGSRFADQLGWPQSRVSRIETGATFPSGEHIRAWADATHTDLVALIGEQLVADYTRRGFVRGRSVRLMTVSVRPGKPNAAASSFMSGIIREPLAGVRATCPVPADTPVALSSPGRTLDGILRAAGADEAAWGSRTAMNLPALATTPREMAAAMDRVAGRGVSDLIDWTDDPVIGAIVRSWPARIETPRANALGLHAVASFDDIVREYLAAVPART